MTHENHSPPMDSKRPRPIRGRRFSLPPDSSGGPRCGRRPVTARGYQRRIPRDLRVPAAARRAGTAGRERRGRSLRCRAMQIGAHVRERGPGRRRPPSVGPTSCRSSCPTRRAGRSRRRTRRPRSSRPARWRSSCTRRTGSTWPRRTTGSASRPASWCEQHADGRGRGRRDRAGRARRARHRGRGPRGRASTTGASSSSGSRRGRLRGADPDREHRGRGQRDGPPVRRAGPAVGRDRRVRGRVLPGHLPRLRRRRGARRRGGPGEGDHRADRPGAPEQLARRVRLRSRPARQHRLRRR